jgi:competence ComEA-like helix-hairpin-helix protein
VHAIEMCRVCDAASRIGFSTLETIDRAWQRRPMMLYNRPQLIVLLLVVMTAGVGLGVAHWRRAHPELVERLEQFDRAAAPAERLNGAPRSAPASHAPSEPASRRAPPPKSAPPPQPVDINRASEDELRVLPGIGSVLASRIVEAREREGPFASLEDLRRVRGLGRAKLERLASAIALAP